MEIIVKFGYRWYVFYNQKDVQTATSIYAWCVGSLDDFENELERLAIEFNYELNP